MPLAILNSLEHVTSHLGIHRQVNVTWEPDHNFGFLVTEQVKVATCLQFLTQGTQRV